MIEIVYFDIQIIIRDTCIGNINKIYLINIKYLRWRGFEPGHVACEAAMFTVLPRYTLIYI